MSEAQSKKLILIIGASSGIGLATTQAALAAGYRVRAFARGADQIPIQHEYLEARVGDALHPSDVDAALAGVDAVVQCLGIPFNSKLFVGPVELFSQATEILIPAMRKALVKRLIAVTGYGAGDSEASIHPLQRLGFNLVFGVAYRDKSRQEQLIKASDLEWTIVRPGVLTNAGERHNYQVLTQADQWKNGLISRASVAHYVVRAIEADASIGTEPVLVN